MNNISNCSNESSDIDVSSESLDKVFTEQVKGLRSLILTLCSKNDINLCRKWLNIFNKITTKEKMARNCLCALMQMQLHELGYLTLPFTNVQNCNRDLEQVLQEVDNPMPSRRSITSETGETFSTETRRQICEIDFNQDQSSIATNSITELEQNEVKTKNIQLIRELEKLRLQLTEKQIEISLLREAADKYKISNDHYEEKFHNIKTAFDSSIKNLLKNLETNDKKKFLPLKIFETIFKDFADKEFLKNVKNLDNQFQTILNQFFETELNRRNTMIASHVCQKYKNAKKKIKKKYEQRLHMKSWAQKLQLKMVKLQCFSELRNIFINSKYHGEDTLWDILKALEQKYQSILNELV